MTDYSEITQRMAEINKHRPFEGESLKQLKNYYKIQTTWASNAVEGNTISLSETQMILENGITIHGHTINEIHECLGHAEAYEYMFSLINDRKITEENIKTMHKLFASNIKNIPFPGEYRDKSKTYVRITGSDYSYPDWKDVPEKMADFVDWLDSVRKENVFHPVELAAEAHRKMIYIHPFPDGNGRVTRLVMNTILLQEHYLPISITPKIRNQYIKLLENGRLEPQKFTDFISNLELKELKEFMRIMHIETAEEKELKNRLGESYISTILQNCKNMPIEKSIDKATKDIYTSSGMAENDFKKLISDFLVDKAIFDRKDLTESIKKSLIEKNITEIKEEKHISKKSVNKSISDDDGMSISD